jgi:membrane associated rhomboid family serine protease
MFPISDSIKSGIFPILNYAIIAATVYVFYLQLTAPNPDAFVYTYSLIPSRINFSDYTTLIPFVTAIFLHGGFLHIISNMWFLKVFGDDVEGTLGKFMFLVLYFGAGIIGNISQYLASPHSDIPMLGASGAVAGILGAYFVLFPYSKIKTLVTLGFFITIINISATFMLGYWIVLQIISAVFSTGSDQGGVAFLAHVGGFITGMIIGNLFKGKSQVLQGEIVHE